MNKEKNYLKIIEERILLNEKKETIFNDLSSQVNNVETFGWYLSHTPYQNLRIKYKIHAIVVAALVVLFCVQSFLFMPNRLEIKLLALLFYIFGFGRLALWTIRFKPGAPLMVSVLGGALCIGFTFIAFRKGTLTIQILFGIAIALAMLFYGLWLTKKLAPHGNLAIGKAPRNKNGQIEFD
jgi:hypothetical protein